MFSGLTRVFAAFAPLAQMFRGSDTPLQARPFTAIDPEDDFTLAGAALGDDDLAGSVIGELDVYDTISGPALDTVFLGGVGDDGLSKGGTGHWNIEWGSGCPYPRM